MYNNYAGITCISDNDYKSNDIYRNQDYDGGTKSSSIYVSNNYFTNSNKSSNMKKNTDGDMNMSFEGMFACDDGVICFADNRNTRNNEIDTVRPFIKKIFNNDKIVVANYGLNEIFNFEYATEPIEGRLTRIVEKDNSDVKQFIDKFSSYLKECKDNRTFKFFILNKAVDKMSEIWFENYEMKVVKASSNSLYCAPTWLIDLFNEYLIKNNTRVVEMQDIINYLKDSIIPVLLTMEKAGLYSRISSTFDIVKVGIDKTEIERIEN